MIFLIEKTLKESSEFFKSNKKSILIVQKNGITWTFFKGLTINLTSRTEKICFSRMCVRIQLLQLWFQDFWRNDILFNI